MAYNQTVNFTPYDEQMAEIQRRQRMAELMQQQAIAPLETPQSGGRMIARVSPLAGLAKMLQAYAAGKEFRDIEKQRGAAEETARTQAMDWLKGFQPSVGVSPNAALQAATTPIARPNDVAANRGINYAMGQSEAALGLEPGTLGRGSEEATVPVTTPAPQQQVTALSPTERQNRLYQGALSGNPYTAKLASVLMAQKPTSISDVVSKPNIENATPESVAAFQQDFATKGVPNYSILQFRNQYTDTTAEGRANRAQAQKHWEGLSADQQANIALRARSGEIEARKLMDDAGVYVPPVSNVSATVTSAPAIQTPIGGQRPVVNRQPTAPGATATPTQLATTLSSVNTAGMSPKQQRELTAKKAEEQMAAQGALPALQQQANNAVSTIDKMLGTLGLNKEARKERFGSENAEKEPHGGFSQWVGFGIPYLSKIHGTDTAGFRAMEEQIKGQSFLDALGKLRGTGQISQKEGEKAEAAVNRMNNAMNKNDYVEAAREFQANVIAGMEIARAKAEGRQPKIPTWTNQYRGVTEGSW